MENKQEKIYYITEFAQKVGVYKDTVRNYQKRGLLPNRRNPVNNYRVFTDADIETVRNILKGKIINHGKQTCEAKAGNL